MSKNVKWCQMMSNNIQWNIQWNNSMESDVWIGQVEEGRRDDERMRLLRNKYRDKYKQNKEEGWGWRIRSRDPGRRRNRCSGAAWPEGGRPRRRIGCAAGCGSGRIDAPTRWAAGRIDWQWRWAAGSWDGWFRPPAAVPASIAGVASSIRRWGVIGPAADCRRGLRGTAVIDPTDPACPEAPGAAGAAVLKSHPAPEWPSEAPFVLSHFIRHSINSLLDSNSII